jgi:centromere protein C
LGNGYHAKHSHHESEEEEEEEEQPEVDDDDDEVDQFVEQSISDLRAATQLPFDSSDPPLPDEAPDNNQYSEEEEEVVRTAPSRGKPGWKPKPKEVPVKAAIPTKRGRPVAEDEGDDEEHQDVNGEEEDSEEPVDEDEPEQAATGRLNKLSYEQAKKGKKAQISPAEPRSRKRRSADTEPVPDEEAPAEPQTKRQRKDAAAPAPAPKFRGRPPKIKVAAPEGEDPGQAGPSRTNKKEEPVEKRKKGRKRKSSIQPGDTSLVVVPRGPPLPKSRGLLINRREAPNDSSNITQTRSGRNSFKPLAFWRNERVDYDTEEAMVDPLAKGPRARKILLPSIKEVVRVDEPEPDYSKSHKSSKRGRGGKSKRGKNKGYGSESDDDMGPAEPWELDPGSVEGHVVCWDPEHETNPPELDELVDVEEKQLALSGAAIQTQPVKGSTFRYAKTLNEGFFNSGVVDLPPGSEKRPKNSRKMFMSFFVHTGRVLVTVNETTFRINKGGMWFVPRGKYFVFVSW